ncbi:hypothetical protein QR680_017802 [Steinernema hermaphroditum]|uniref:Uncharacterized protein n=1 Tax=Steinernema hermaphroditum TaxID=289476 RepID=A0AA39HFW4_9BILA|nr:hypothetical protein QR680_017802 [Steinernema hermaphroditum]
MDDKLLTFYVPAGDVKSFNIVGNPTRLLSFVFVGYCCARIANAAVHINHYKRKIAECYQPPILDARYFGNPPDYVKVSWLSLALD